MQASRYLLQLLAPRAKGGHQRPRRRASRDAVLRAGRRAAACGGTAPRAPSWVTEAPRTVLGRAPHRAGRSGAQTRLCLAPPCSAPPLSGVPSGGAAGSPFPEQGCQVQSLSAWLSCWAQAPHFSVWGALGTGPAGWDLGPGGLQAVGCRGLGSTPPLCPLCIAAPHPARTVLQPGGTWVLLPSSFRVLDKRARCWRLQMFLLGAYLHPTNLRACSPEP